MPILLLLWAFVGAPARASIVEDLNARGLTYLYEVRGTEVFRWLCKEGSSRELKRESCERAGTVSLAAFLFQAKSAFAARAQENARRDLALTGEAGKLAVEQAGLRTQIRQLEGQLPKPLEKLSELSGRYRAVEKRLEAIAVERQRLAAERSAAEDILETGKLLRDPELHAFSASQPEPGSPAVEVLETAYQIAAERAAAAHAGRGTPGTSPTPGGRSTGTPATPGGGTPPVARRYRNTWWDPTTGRRWYADFRPRTWPEARAACPAGYALVTAAGHTRAMLEDLARLRRAYDAGETAFTQRPDSFWGWEVPRHLSGVRIPTAYWFRPWSEIPIHQDRWSARHAIVCVSRAAVQP